MNNNKPNTIIGLEVHIQLNLKSKLFCTCQTTGNEEPNTRTCPVCLGHPGSKPLVNKKAIEAAIRLALALGTQLNNTITFSRKSYFYPDLAKSYQITQYEIPIATNGTLTLPNGKPVHITRLHLEEDPAALTHTETTTLIDHNRSGIPLIELVTAPELTTPEEARDFMNTLLTIIGYLNIHDPTTGILKADANISIAKHNYTRVEIKNILGFKEIERALTHEQKRQHSHDVIRETRGWDATTGHTYSMRTKEEEADYGYILEPDIPTITITQEQISALRTTVPELPQTKAQRWVQTQKINSTDASIIASDLTLATLYENLTQHHNPTLVSRWLRRELLRALNLSGKTVQDIKEENLHELFQLLETKKITDRIAQQLIEELARKDFSPKQRVEEQKLGIVGDEELILETCKKILAENKKAVADYKSGEEKAFHYLFGQAMKALKGKAKPDMIKEKLKELLD